MTERSVDKKTEALKLALGYMDGTLMTEHLTGYERKRHVMQSIREALAEQCVCGEPDTFGTHRTDGPCLAEQPAPVAKPHEQQELAEASVEPVARCMEHGECFGGECIYTSPPNVPTARASKPWVQATTWRGLTDDEINKMTVLMGINPEWKAEIEIVRSIVRNLEAKLKAKNSL